MMKHQILILDDSVERHSLFSKLLGPKHDEVFTAENLLSSIQKGQIVAEVLLLDHDLGSNMDGTELVKTIQSEKLTLPTVRNIFIHSNNSYGANRMVQILRETFPEKTIEFLPSSRINDMWNDLGRDSEALRKILLSDTSKESPI